jgi:hypothetical protein
MVVEHDPSDILFVEYLLDGDHDSAMESAGWGLDGDYGEDY